MGSLTPSGPVVVAVDGGGSKTDVQVLDLDGHVVAQSRGGGSNPQLIGVQESVDLIDSLVREALDAVPGRPVLQSCVYLSGLDLPVEIEVYAAAVARCSWATGSTGRPAVVDNDLFALLRAGTQAPDAVALVCGTGINCIGLRADGRQVRFPALGMISGDWGGGWHLGEQALWHAARAVDGRGPATTLVTSIPAVLGLGSVREVTEALHFGRVPPSALADLSPTVLAAAREGDAVALGLVDRQVEEIVLMVTCALRGLDLLDAEVPVVLGGGVLAAREPLLMAGIAAGIAAVAPRACIALVTAPPIVGAAALALEKAGCSGAALRAAASAV